MPGARNQHNTVQPPVKSALIEAIEKHEEDDVDRLIAEGVDVLDTDSQGRAALLCAVQSNVDINIIRALVEKGKVKINGRDEIADPRAQINAKDRYGRSSLFYATTKSSDTASYLFGKAGFLNDSDIISILLFFIESLCTKRHDSHPTIDEVLPLLEAKRGLKPKKLAKLIVQILLCKLPLLLISDTRSYRPRNAHPMFHLHGKRKTLLDILNKVSDCDCLRNYQKKENIKEVLKKIERRESIFDILKLLKEHNPDRNFADSDGNTALHYAACLPWMGVPIETAKEICKSLQSFEVPLDIKNHLGQTPLLFCLSPSMEHLEEDDKLAAMTKLVEVCNILVAHGSSLAQTTQNGESVFHLVMDLFRQGLEIPNKKTRQSVTEKTNELLHLFTPPGVGSVAKERDDEFKNSPLHLWASLMLTVPDYNSCVTQELSFKDLLKVILDHLLNCGALKNDKNNCEETPLHLCNTWSAVTLLIDADANPNDVDSKKRPPLLVAASKPTFLRDPSHFYPDVQEDAQKFFENAIEEKRLDPWAVDKSDESVLGFLIKFETYDLSKALVEVACNLSESDTESQKIFVSLLKAICKDESLRTQWKTKLVDTVLSCAKERKISVVNEPFNVCCETISELRGKVGNEPSPSYNRTAEKSDEAENPEENKYEIESTVQCKIAKILRSHGAELSGESYKKLKSTYKEIDKILENTVVQRLIPWTSISKRHKNELDKVARRQECQEIGGAICYYKAPTGSFGVDLLVGINKQNSKEVFLKRIGEAESTQDLKNLYAELDCEQVIRYFLHLEAKDDKANIVYIVFELMEGNLVEYLDSDAFDPSKGASLCGDIIKGLNYLHERDISHFQDHLKPTSIFYKTHPDLCLKVTDFDHRQPADRIPIYVWSSPEVLKDPKNHSESSDIFSCGLLLHYILTKGKHPFSPADCTNKSETDIVSEMRNNIIHNKSTVEDSLSPEATHLLQSMLERDQSKRPFTEKGSSALDHPFFWPKKEKIDFLTAVGNQPEFEFPPARVRPPSLPVTPVESGLEAKFGTIVNINGWNNPGYLHMPHIYAAMTSGRGSRRSYDTRSVVQLVRFIRNAYAHVSDSTKPTAMKKQLLVEFVFLEYFPNLVMEVYKAVTTHGWDQKKEEIKYALKK